MLTMQKVTLGDIPLLRDRFERYPSRTADCTVGGTVLWRDFFDMEYGFAQGALLISSVYPGLGRVFCFPIGEEASFDGALGEVLDWFRRAGLPPVFSAVPSDLLPALTARFPAEVSPDRNYFDYLYLQSDLAALAGRHYAGQRNHINAFLRERAFEYRPITAENAPAVREFFLSTRRAGGSGERERPPYAAALAAAELSGADEVFTHWDQYGFLGGCLLSEGRVIAAAVGDAPGEVLFVHLERADASVRGAYQLMVREFARRAPAGVRFVNREDDVGEPGLRAAKLAYHPCCLLEKYTVRIRTEEI